MRRCQVSDKCPCENCICVPICKNMMILPVLKKCIIVYKYLVKSESGKGTTLDMFNLMEYCSVMNIKLVLNGKNFDLEYNWEKLI